MGLQVWLPLNGDLHNQGLSNYEIKSNGLTLENTGKIGKNYSFNGTNSYIYIPNVSLGNTWSYGCWIYMTTSETDAWKAIVILNSTGGGDSDSQLALWIKRKQGYIESLANTQYNSNISYTSYYGGWHHIFATFNGSTLITYVDGTSINTKSITAAQYVGANLTIGARCTNATGTTFSNYLDGKLCDFRIYDTCLTPEEVKEIAEGLILHYPLDQPNVNLLTDGVLKAAPFGNAVEFRGSYQGKDGVLGVKNNTLYNQTSSGTNDIFSGIKWDGVSQYTISGDWRDDRTDGKSSSLYLRFHYTDGNASSVTSPTSNQGQWTHFKMTSNASKVVDKMTTTYANGGLVHIANLKLEKGAFETLHTKYNYNKISNATVLNSNFNILLNGSIERSNNSQTNNILYYYYERCATLPTGTYTFSFDAHSSNGTDGCYFSYANGSSTIQRIGELTNIPTTYTHYSYTFTVSATNSNDIFFTNYTGHGGSSSPNTNNTGYLYIKNVKLEAGSTETAWRAATCEENNQIIYDTSGFGNNGQVVGDLTVTQDSPIYDYATVFANGAYIRKTDMAFSNNYWTVSCWFKKTSSVTSAYETMLGLTRINGADANKKFSLYVYSNKIGCVGEQTTNPNITTFDTSKWHHACLVKDGGSFTYYMDGTSIKTFSNSNNLSDCTDFVVGGRAGAEDATYNGNPWGGYLSDVRLYVTAFSADQVQALYKNSKNYSGTNLVPRSL